ncbi:MAG: preprotein translocase subunit SecA [Phycisphaerales bacterium]|nr:preprotein translocase subunit SecA [Phycisphaerales bacterium]
MAKSNVSKGIPIVGPILNLIIGTRNERFVKRYMARVEAVNALEPQVRKLTDAQIREMVKELRERVEKGETLDSVMAEALAVAREAMDRSVGIRNIFNPKHEAKFDPSKLPSDARAIYDAVKAQIATREPAPPTGEFLGCTEPEPGWLQVDIQPELYEAVRQIYTTSKPPFRARPFDVQLIGAMVLSGGKISEMKTGEGKTIVAPLACYLATIEGLPVHVVTVNDYLVQRDRDWTYPYFHALGLTVGAIHPQHMQPEYMKRDMYRCDVVYGTTSEFGFDYLRDQMKRKVEQQVQRERAFAIVDEVDSILIDEARTPLIISGEAHEGSPRYDLADKISKHLVARQIPWQQADDKVKQCQRLIKGLEGDIRNARDRSKIPALEAQMSAAKAQLPKLEAERSKFTQFYEVELDRKQVHLTHDGIAEAQRVANLGSFYVGENMDLPHLLTQSVRAHVVYERDKDYIVMPVENPRTGKEEPGVVIVDVNTGRPMIGRQWSDGLHQAVESKEGVPIKQETQTVATVTIQNYFKMYKRLAGMTGTADTEAQEFHDIYRLDVVSIPTNLPVHRKDRDDLMFLVVKDKWDAIVDEIKSFHDVGRPVLVGTTSVEKSESLAKMLTAKHGVKPLVLNARPENVSKESTIVEDAGQLGSVMIATNMAGRGTDIKLGPVSRETLMDHWLRRGIASREIRVDMTDEQLRENIYRKIAAKELNKPKHEVENLPADQLEPMLLRQWAMKFTFASGKQIDSASVDELRSMLDESGRCLMHRLRWFDTIEDMGGLHVIGTERHESRRIDNQLRGRSGRQGDNGSSRFFVSLEDDLMKMFAGERTMKILSTLGMKEGDAIEHPMLSKSVERAQRKIEERNFQIRKNILEYDEVMEHQRQAFYGLRQRVLEGRDVRGLIFTYIRDATRDAASEYLAPGYAAKCAADFVREKLDVTIFPDRLKGLELNEMEKRIREEAKAEARQMIQVTLGEYIPEEGSEVEVDFDAEGLARWARSRFGVEFNPEEIREKGQSGRRAVQEALSEAAFAQIDEADLSELVKYVDKAYGPAELCKWADKKFSIKITPEEVAKAQALPAEKNQTSPVEKLILDQAEKLYTKREIEYPVEFVMAATMNAMRQNPAQAMQQLITWANERYQLGWTPESVMKTPPLQVRQQLLDASKKYVESGELQKRIAEAMAITDHDALDKHLREKLRTEPPENLRRLKGAEREQQLRAKVESALRAELLYFERTMLIETLDELWKDHLYQMDQLRDTINYRAFSQQDPRIEYKREGSKLFKQMMETVRDRVTDYVFTLNLVPQAAPQQQMPMPQQRPTQPQTLGGNGAGGGGGGGGGGGLYVPPSGSGQLPGGGTISGPGLG